MQFALGLAFCVAALVAQCEGELAPASESANATRTESWTPSEPSLVVAATEEFLDFYTDPFDNTTLGYIPFFPPSVIADNGHVNKVWEHGHVVVPPHLDFFSFNLWHGTPSAITPYLEEDYIVDVQLAGKAVEDVKLEFKRFGAMTASVEAEILCRRERDIEASNVGTIRFTIRRRGHPGVAFKLVKHCQVVQHEDLLVSSQSGQVLFSRGKINSAFNLHDIRTEPFIASKESQSDTFYFHTLSEQYRLVGTPTVAAYKPNERMLKWITERSPMLQRAVVDASKESSEQDFEDEFLNENADADDIYGENVDAFEGSGMAKEESATRAPAQAAPTFVRLGHVSNPITHTSDVCRPSLVGDLAHKEDARIVHRKDYGEAKLMGFAQAGLLGMHGAKRLTVRYNCMQDGLAFVVVRATVESLDDQDQVRLQEEIVFSYLKVCSAGQIGPDQIDLMGMDVRLGAYVRSEPAFYPVINGLTSEPFSWDGMQMVASPEETHTSFYVHLRHAVERLREELGNTQLLRIRRVRIHNRYTGVDIFRPRLSGRGAHGGLLTAEALPITIHYHCRKTGNAKTGIDLLVDVVDRAPGSTTGELVPVSDGTVRRISFFWTKQCVVEPLIELGARTVDPALFEPTSLEAYNRDYVHVPVIQDGVVLPAFEQAGKPEFHVNADEPVFAFELFKHDNPAMLSSPEEEPHRQHKEKHAAPRTALSFRAPLLVSSAPDVVAVSLRNIGEMERLVALGKLEFLSEEGAQGLSEHQNNHHRHQMKQIATNFEEPIDYKVSSKNKLYFVIDHVCAGMGFSDITLELPMHSTTEKTFKITWRKDCSWTNSHLSTSRAGGAIVLSILAAVLLTSTVFFFRVRKQREHLDYLQSLDLSDEEFEKMVFEQDEDSDSEPEM